MIWYDVKTSELLNLINDIYRTGSRLNMPNLLKISLDELEKRCPLMRVAYH